MKILIWLGCAFVYSLIVTGLSAAGIILGGIPAMCLAGCAIFAAQYFCREYDTHKKDRQAKPVTVKSVASMIETSLTKISQVSTSKPTEQHPQKSAPTASASNPYKKAYIIALIVAGCLFLACSVLGLRYYYDTMELNQTIADYQENIQQLETDLQTAQDDLKYKDQHIQIVRNSVKSQRILSYNDGFEDGYIQGYNDAVETKAKYPVLLPDIDEYLLPYHFE